MKRRDFFKWAGRLLAALPFVALADLGPEYQEGGIISTFEPIDIWSQSPVETGIRWMPDGETIHSISLKDVLVFNEYSKEQLQDFWQQLRDTSGQEYYFNYVWRE